MAAGDFEAHVPQIEPEAAVDPHFAVEDLVVLVVAVGAVEVVTVPLEPRVGPQRPGDLPGGAGANRPERKVFDVQRELLEGLVLDHREREADDRAESIGRYPRVRDPGYRQDLAEDLLVARVDQREDPGVPLALRDAE